MIDLSKNEMRRELPFNIGKMFSNMPDTQVKTYPSQSGFVQKLMQRHGLEDRDHIEIYNGIESFLSHMFSRAQANNFTVLLPSIGWDYYHKLANDYGASTAIYGINEQGETYQTDAEDVLRQVDVHSSASEKTLVLLNTPANPTGHSLDSSDFECLMSSIPKNHLVVVDETYFGYNDNEDTAGELIQEHDNLVVARSFSKRYGTPGARIGYALTGKQARSALNISSAYLGFNVFADRIATACLEHEAEFKTLTQKIVEQREKFAEFLRNTGQAKPYVSDANFLLARLFGFHAHELRDRLKDQGIKIKSFEDDQLENHIRVSIGSEDEMSRLEGNMSMILES